MARSLRDGVQQPLTGVAAAGEDAGMIALIQRVSEAAVRVGDELVGEIGPGLLALVAVQPGDGEASIERMAERLLAYRVFSDPEGRMNLSLAQTGGGLLLVSQFTLAADTRKGLRPSFTSAAPPEAARAGFERLLERCRARHPVVETGRFGAHMRVSLVNDGPVTFWLQT
jgi:D-tyrosyl-tRNA(Tyr) deacylase